ncbi:hypothetical protein GGU10DRAFT_381178 [Lentinula aff. detonsa]|uniref:Uncharacterized protein n=1 Tax=Lentinula aff. detonsa TaxID=2804958 RepID=A0AA38KBG0_9AGAR|nr:hypothetical protein GGU10DRAFT_381178 [Lentinula aff. detonsa]
MLSQTMKFLLGTLVLALVVSSQVQAAAIPVFSRMSTDKADGTSTSTAVRRFDVEPAEMLEMREMSDTAEWDFRRRSIGSLIATNGPKLLAMAHNTKGGATNAKGEQDKSKGIHHAALDKLKSLVPSKAAAPAKPIEPAKPHEPAELPKPSEEPPSQQPSAIEKATDAAKIVKEGAGAAGAVGATVSTLKGGDQAPAAEGAAGAPVGDDNAPVPTNKA